MKRFLHWLFVFAFAAVLCPQASAGPSGAEAGLDAQAYAIQKPQIRENLPQAKVLAQLAARIEPVVARIYGTPFSFYLIGERGPDAFEYYGPRVYVSRGMVDFADSREELAGVMCHEASHVLHHDGSHSDNMNAAYDGRIAHMLRRLPHGRRIAAAVAGEAAKLAELHYSRSQEEAADLSGASVCAGANSNPWGIVWMLRKLQRAAPMHGFGWFSDHPTNKARIAALSKYLRRNATFAAWTDDEKLGSTSIRR